MCFGILKFCIYVSENNPSSNLIEINIARRSALPAKSRIIIRQSRIFFGVGVKRKLFIPFGSIQSSTNINLRHAGKLGAQKHNQNSPGHQTLSLLHEIPEYFN